MRHQPFRIVGAVALSLLLSSTLGVAYLRTQGMDVGWLDARDWRYGVAITGVATTWLPWLLYDDRPIFIFYAIITIPFMILAITLLMGRMLGTSTTPSPRRTLGVIVSGAFFVLVLLNFAWFWPIYTDQLLTHREWLDRIWFTRWI